MLVCVQGACYGNRLRSECGGVIIGAYWDVWGGLLKYTGVLVEACSARSVGVGNWNTQGACLSIIGVCWGLWILLGYSEGAACALGQVSDMTAGCLDVARHFASGAGVRDSGYSEKPGAGVPGYPGVPAVYWGSWNGMDVQP